jgi:hypothetical protein
VEPIVLLREDKGDHADAQEVIVVVSDLVLSLIKKFSVFVE